jgi:hypothetical protein
MDSNKTRVWHGVLIVLLPLLLMTRCVGQQVSTSTANGSEVSANYSTEARYTRLEEEMQAVMTALSETRRQLDASHEQIEELRHELGVISAQLPMTTSQTNVDGSNQTAADLKNAVTQLQENDGILQAQVKQLDQTKVESVSKYPVKISGLILFTSLLNNGSVDDVYLPTLAVPRTTYMSSHSLTATMRQSVFGLDAKGPHLWGAQTSGDFRVDFFGGAPTAGYDASAGTLRMRTAHFTVDWPGTSIIASVDTPLISPLYPASYLSVAQPALAWSGNLWTWAPQFQVNQRFSAPGHGSAEVEFGLIDPATPTPRILENPQQPSPGESSRQLGYETRFQYAFSPGDRPMVIGAGGYYARQSYSQIQHVDAWAGTADWKIPLGSRLEVAGEAYRGRGIGGLGGGAFKDYVFDATTGRVSGLDAVGGWSQIKARLTASLEANGAFGQDSGYAGEIRYTHSPLASVYQGLARNRTVLGNVIFRPRAYIVLSGEYRNIHTWQVVGPANQANIFGLAAGYLF